MLASGTRERSRATLDITVRSWLGPWRMSHSSDHQPRLRKEAERRPHPLKISMISGAVCRPLLLPRDAAARRRGEYASR